MASATVSITERTRCSLARRAPVILSARSMAPRRASASDQTKPKISRVPRPPPARITLGSHVGCPASKGGRAVTRSVQGRPATVTALTRESALAPTPARAGAALS